jgi:hypothetical protein
MLSGQDNLVERVRREAPDGFKAELLIAKNMRLAAKANGNLEMQTLCDELEEAASSGDAVRTAKARKMLLDQAQFTVKRMPASNPVTAPVAASVKAGMKKGEELGTKLVAFLDRRRKRR